jgi:hypothetical protein
MYKCEDVKKILARKCSTCDNLIVYKTKVTLQCGIDNNRRCRTCSNIGKNTGRIPDEKSRLKMSVSQKGRKHSKETIERMKGENNGMFGIFRCGKDNPFFGKKHGEKTRLKMRISAANRILNKGGPNIGIKETSYFYKLDLEMDWDGIFYGKNDKQYYVKELGYFVDYYEPSKNIVVEYDEPRHYRCNQLKNEDIYRMNSIIDHLKCRFLRYDEKKKLLIEYFNQLEITKENGFSKIDNTR